MLERFFLIVLFFIMNIMNLFSNSYIVKLKSGTDTKKDIESIQKLGNLKPAFRLDLLNNIKKDKILSNEQKNYLEKFSDYFILETTNQNIDLNNQNIEYIERNYIYKIEQTSIIPNDQYFKNQWAIDNTGVKIAWNYASGKGIKVAVIDTGIDFFHPDLINQLWVNSEEDLNKNGQFDPWSSLEIFDGIYGDLNGIDDDSNGFKDDVIGYDFVDQTAMNIGDSKDSDPVPTDEHSHGTSVAGVIVAQRNNKIGISGIAFDSKVISCRAFDATGNGESDDIANAIVYAVLQGAKILNFSFGEVYPSSIVHDAIKFANISGVTMVASSGNNNWDLKHYPSDFEEVISVGSSNSENMRGSNGNFGNRLDITAPGVKIFTTLPDTSYGEKSGTSFAAPHVAAAVCLILERFPDLTPQEVNGLLQSSAKDVGEFGWDYNYASGILNIGNAMQFIGRTNISISNPENEVFIEKEMLNLTITGNITTPLFKSYNLYIGDGERPKYWTLLVNEATEQILNDTIYKLDLTNLKDTTYTFRLVVKLSNNNTLEKRFYINLLSKATALDILKINPIQVYDNDYKTVAIYSVTNYPSYFYFKYRPKGSSEEYKTLSEYQKFTNFHSVLVTEQINIKTKFEAIAVAHLPNGIKDEQTFEFEIDPDYISENKFHQKGYGFPLSYLLNDVADLYGNGKQCIVVNDLSTGSWGNIKIYQFENGEFYTKDYSTKKWIPKGIGDSNGDKIPEIFSTVFRESALFQPKQIGDSPFTNIIFQDTMSLNFWAQDMFDIDKDGLDEIIAYSDTSFLVYKFTDGKYKLLAIADPNINIGTYPGFARGDFDSDGKNEICFGNRDGNIFIYEFSNNNLVLEYTDSSTFSSSEQYITQGDFNADGIPEIVIGNFGSSIPYGFEEASDPLWTFRIFASTGNGKYNPIDTISIFNVRGGIEYNNGVVAGNVDADSQDELIISTFPNLYVFKWDNQKNGFVSVWNYPYSYSNSAIINDFDKNGINEIGFSTFNGTRFFEMENMDSPEIPLGFKAWSIDTNKIYFEWLETTNAESYEILNMIRTESGGYQGFTVTSTNSNSATIDTFANNTHYEFVVRAINPSMPTQASEISNIFEVYTHKPIYPMNVKVIDKFKIEIEFSGDVTTNHINPGDFHLLNDKLEFIQTPLSVLQNANNKVLLTLKNEMKSGDNNLIVKTFRDKYYSPIVSDTLNFEFVPSIEEYFLYLSNLIVLNRTELKLNFSENIDAQTATNQENYQIEPYGSIENISMDEDSKKAVIIKLSNEPQLLANGKIYTITVTNVTSEAGNKITTGAGNTLGFVFFASDANDAYIYPNPVKYSTNPELYFANLPDKAEVTIFNLEMQELKTLEETDGNGGVEWDGRNSKGELLNSGVYVFKVTKLNADGTKEESEIKKFIILP